MRADEGAPLRIAYLSYRGKPHVGGQGVYTRHLTKALVDLGHTVEVLGGQPYPVLDDRITLTKLPSLDIFNDQYPGRFPAYWELKTKADWAEAFSHIRGTFGEPLAFSMRALQALKKRQSDFDVVHDNQCLGYSILGIEKLLPTVIRPAAIRPPSREQDLCIIWRRCRDVTCRNAIDHKKQKRISFRRRKDLHQARVVKTTHFFYFSRTYFQLCRNPF